MPGAIGCTTLVPGRQERPAGAAQVGVVDAGAAEFDDEIDVDPVGADIPSAAETLLMMLWPAPKDWSRERIDCTWEAVSEVCVCVCVCAWEERAMRARVRGPR